VRSDDSDMKIAGEVFREQKAADDTEEMSRLLAREKANGNLSRARRLGAIMAEDVAAIEGEQVSEDSVLLTQRRILLAFAVEIGLEKVLPNPLLAQTAQNIFYETLRQTAPDFYEDLQSSGAFSFYYLCVRDKKNVERRVGETYASLCSRPNDKGLCKQGTDLYLHFIEQVRVSAQSMEFVK
jgi:hypothetical protein